MSNPRSLISFDYVAHEVQGSAETPRFQSFCHIILIATEEVKLDGYRALAVRSGAGITLFSRRRKSLNRQFPYIVDALASLPEGTVVDGELVTIDANPFSLDK